MPVREPRFRANQTGHGRAKSRLGASIVAAAALSAIVFCSIAARARVQAESEYSKQQTYSGALRFLRVDLGYEVLEKDPDAAYLIFRYQTNAQNKESSTGSIEIISSDDKALIFIQLTKMPEYHERLLRDGLIKKLRAEYGAPPSKKPKKPAEPPKDAGA